MEAPVIPGNLCSSLSEFSMLAMGKIVGEGEAENGGGVLGAGI